MRRTARLRRRVGDDLQPGGAEGGVALPGRARIGVGERGDDAGHARLGEGDGAGGRHPVMRAGLERDIGGRPPRRRAGRGERPGLGMGPPARRGRGARHDAPLPHEDAADGGVGPRGALSAQPEPESEREKARIRLGERPGGARIRLPGRAGAAFHSPVCSVGRSSLTNLSKSSAAWKFL